MEEKNLKVTLAARVIPELKEGIIQEAEERGMTPSKFIETVLLNRDSIDSEKVSELESEVEELRKNNVELKKELGALGEEFDELEEEVYTEKKSPVKNELVKIEDEGTVTILKDQIRLLNKEKVEIDTQLSEVIEERDSLSEKLKIAEENVVDKVVPLLNFEEDEKDAFRECLDKIREEIDEKYSELSDEKIALIAIKLTVRNQTTWHFLERFSSYLPDAMKKMSI